jgi:hypothetical protein
MTSSSYLTNRLNNTYYTEIAIPDVSSIKQFYMTPDQTTTIAPTYYGVSICNNMTNLFSANVRLPQTITSVNTSFCSGMFQNCSSLTTISAGFNLPQGITGPQLENFCISMFNGCSALVSLPSGFKLPPGISGVQAYSFCQNMFLNCSALTSIPMDFNIPIGISGNQGGNFCRQMFQGCTLLTNGTPNQALTIPSTITGGASYLCTDMFKSSGITPPHDPPLPGDSILIKRG